MTQTVVQSVEGAWANAGASLDLTLNGVAAGNALEVRVTLYYGNTAASTSVSVQAGGALTWQLGARAQSSSGSGVTAEVHYAENAGGGNYTIRVTTTAAADFRYGWAELYEIAGRATSSSLDSAATGTANGSSATPAVAGAGSTTQANAMIVAVLSADGGSSNLGIDAISGNSLSWNNRLIKQDPNAEMGGSFDDAAATSTLTPSVNWGTMSSSPKWAAVVVAFKDAGGGPVEEDIQEDVEVGSTFAADAVAVAARSEAAEVGDSYAVVARASVGRSEGVELGDDYQAELGAEVEEAVELGDSYAVTVRAAAGSSEAVELGDSYVASGAEPVIPRGGRTWLPEPPRPLDPAEFDVYLLEIGHASFAIRFVVSSDVQMAAEQAPQFDYALAWEALAEVAIGFEQDGSAFVLRSTVPPLRKDAAPVMPRAAVVRVRLAMEQDPGEVELEVA